MASRRELYTSRLQCQIRHLSTSKKRTCRTDIRPHALGWVSSEMKVFQPTYTVKDCAIKMAPDVLVARGAKLCGQKSKASKAKHMSGYRRVSASVIFYPKPVLYSSCVFFYCCQTGFHGWKMRGETRRFPHMCLALQPHIAIKEQNTIA